MEKFRISNEIVERADSKTKIKHQLFTNQIINRHPTKINSYVDNLHLN